MSHRATHVAVLAVVAAGLALSQQACAGNSTRTPGSAAPVKPASATEAASTKAAPNRSTPATTGTKGSGGSGGSRTAVAVCRSSDMQAELTFQPEGITGNTRMALLTLTNRSAHLCKVEGRAAISLTNAADEVVDVPVKDVAQPGEAVPITLKAGRSVFQGIKWTTCDKADTACGVGNGLRFNLEASTDGPAVKLIGFPAAEASDITMGSLSIGTLQPSAQGVVAW